MKLKVKKVLELEINNKLVEKKIEEVLVYKNEGKRKYQRVIKTRNTYYYPKDENGIPDLNWRNRSRSYDSNNIGEKVPLFSDLIINNLQVLCQNLINA
ncbi:hypothetical protein [endosymbiont DhMRE of Dentiscutata heterogama]|uniref:hypothetical protein n=1 Tax=endosymbiont DhMRE of Dentiscutata heterogama TaxID=1609546 RepID=UPI002AD3BCED|nr:hypothetical protein [endosymbiont DhMRE of Dentiscutata heterogama]